MELTIFGSKGNRSPISVRGGVPASISSGVRASVKVMNLGLRRSMAGLTYAPRMLPVMMRRVTSRLLYFAISVSHVAALNGTVRPQNMLCMRS